MKKYYTRSQKKSFWSGFFTGRNYKIKTVSSKKASVSKNSMSSYWTSAKIKKLKRRYDDSRFQRIGYKNDISGKAKVVKSQGLYHVAGDKFGELGFFKSPWRAKRAIRNNNKWISRGDISIKWY